MLILNPAEFNESENNKINKNNRTLKNKKTVSFNDTNEQGNKEKNKITSNTILIFIYIPYFIIY